MLTLHEIVSTRMKVSVPKKTNNNDRKSGFLPPPIPLERPTNKVLQKDEYLVMKLRSVPNKSNSPVYELNVPYFKDGTPEEWMKFLINFKKIIIGQDLSTGPTQFAMARRLLMGETLTEFNKKVEELKVEATEAADEGVAITDRTVETIDNLDVCFKAVTSIVLPPKALQTQKRYMRRVLRKPQGMKIREYFGRYLELNEYLKEFPPFNGASQKLPSDEVLEHAEFAIPNSWQRQMVLHGFNTISRSINEFIEFCERLEVSESIFDSAHRKSQKTNTQTSTNGTIPQGRDGKSNGRTSGHKRKATNYFCLYHKENATHNTDQCKVLKAQADRMSAQLGRGGSSYKGKNDKFKSDSKSNSKDFQSFAAEVVEQVVKKMKKSEDKNRENYSFNKFREMSVSSNDSSTE